MVYPKQNMSPTTVKTTQQCSVNIVWMKGAKYTKRGDGDVTMKPTHHVSKGDQTDTQMWVFKK